MKGRLKTRFELPLIPKLKRLGNDEFNYLTIILYNKILSCLGPTPFKVRTL